MKTTEKNVQVARCFGLFWLYFTLDQFLFVLTRKFRGELGRTVIQGLPVDVFILIYQDFYVIFA